MRKSDRTTKPDVGLLRQQNGQSSFSLKEDWFAPQHVARFKSAGIPLSLAFRAGIVSVRKGEENALFCAGFPGWQVDLIRLPALLIPVLGPDGKPGLHQARSDDPRTGPDGKVVKYETPADTPLAIYFPPGAFRLLRDRTRRRYYTESPLKALALAARGLAAFASIGVWGWRYEEEPLPDLLELGWEGCDTRMFPDSDVATKPEVFQGQQRLREQLREWGSRATCYLIPARPDGTKQGVDDFLGPDKVKGEDDLLALPVFDFKANYPASPKYRQTVDDRLRFKGADREAEVELAAAAFMVPSDSTSAAKQLATEQPEIEWAIADLHAEGSNTLVVAPRKWGKTTLGLNATRSIADGKPLVGHSGAALPPGKSLVYLNYEMSRRTWLNWFRNLGVRHPSRVFPLHLRGQRLAITDPAARTWLGEFLREVQAHWVVVDPWRRAMSDCGLNENDNNDTSTWTGLFDEIKREAGVPNALVIVHASSKRKPEEGDEHSRGASALEDWADGLWYLTRVGEQRYLRAEGRDILVPESALAFDPQTRLLGPTGGGSRHEERVRSTMRDILLFVQKSPSASTRQVEAAISAKTDTIRDTLSEAERDGLLKVDRSGKAHLHVLTAKGREWLTSQ
jgi:hypothetical protein